MRKSTHALLSVGLLATAPVHALDLVVVEYANDLRTPLSDHEVKNILVYDNDGTPRLNLVPEQSPKHRALVELLKPGFYVDQPKRRDEIAGWLARLPEQCRANGTLALAVEPIGDIDTCVPGETDNRRVTQLEIHDCAETVPRECSYDLAIDGGCNFEIGGLRSFLHACSDALHQMTGQKTDGASR